MNTSSDDSLRCALTIKQESGVRRENFGIYTYQLAPLRCAEPRSFVPQPLCHGICCSVQLLTDCYSYPFTLKSAHSSNVIKSEVITAVLVFWRTAWRAAASLLSMQMNSCYFLFSIEILRSISCKN